MKANEKNKNAILLVILFLLLVVALGIAYALSQKTLYGTKENIIRSGNLELTVGEEGNTIELTDALPVTDEEGQKNAGYDFTVSNTGDFTASYTISLEDEALDSGETRLADENVKFSLTANGSQSAPATLASTLTGGKRVLYNGSIANGSDTIDTFNLKLWVNEDFTGDIEYQVFKAKLAIDASTRPAS